MSGEERSSVKLSLGEEVHPRAECAYFGNMISGGKFMCRVISFEDRWGQMQVTWIGAAAVLITHDFEREGRSR